MGLSLIVKYDCGCIHSYQPSRCSKCITMADPDLCPRHILKEIVLPQDRKCTAFQTRVLEVKCRRPYSWEVPMITVTQSGSDTKQENAGNPPMQDESLLQDTTGSAEETVAQSDDKGQYAPGFQLHQTHRITEFPIPRGTWIKGRWKAWRAATLHE